MAGDLNGSGSEKTAIPTSSNNTAPSKRPSENPIWNFSSILNPAKILAWLGVSTGGLGILLAVIGFLAIGAHDAMLGIPSTSQKLDYIKAGGLFLSRSIIFIFGAIITNKWCWLLLGILLVISIFHRYIYKRHPEFMFLFDVFMLIFAQAYVFWRLGRILQYGDILLKPVLLSSSKSYILSAILKNDKNWLHNEYGFLAIFILCLTMAFKRLDQAYQSMNTLKINISRIQLVWKWIRIPAIVILVIIFFLLPRAYGVLTFSNEYPQVLSILPTPSNPLDFKDSGFLPFLLKQDEKFLILYDSYSYTIVNLSLQSVNQYRISTPKLIFNSGGD